MGFTLFYELNRRDSPSILKSVVPLTEEPHQMPQPEGLHAGAWKPPEPEGIPWARMQPADISFSTSAQWHWGQGGVGSPLERTKCSKQWQQLLHWYS